MFVNGLLINLFNLSVRAILWFVSDTHTGLFTHTTVSFPAGNVTARADRSRDSDAVDSRKGLTVI